MRGIVISSFARPQTINNSMFAHIVCRNWPTHAQNAHENEALLCGSDLFIEIAKAMPAIVIATASRGHKT